MAALSTLIAAAPAIQMGHTALTASIGDVVVTGVGFKPNWIICYGAYDNAASSIHPCVGYYDGTTYQASAKTVYGTVPNYWQQNSTTRFYDFFDAGLLRNSGTIKSFDSDGFTIDKKNYGFSATLYWIVGR